ncbi:MAG: ABC transporter ATP-binding protein [Eubacterium sp.]|nr:ABC transporter ATP-binding protein [Eubacterium sp.]
MEIEFINMTYKRKKFILRDITFKIREGYITALIGKNGAGKTTLFHALLDKNAGYEGEILADGADWRRVQAECMNQTAFVSDEQKFFMNQTALENVSMLQWLFAQFSLDSFQESMERMNLSVQKKLCDMSRGEYLKYQLAFGMAHGSQLYLLDEATAGMDPVFKREFFQMLHTLLVQEHCAVLMSTHLQDEIEKHMDYIVHIEAGRIVSEYEVGMDQQFFQ